MPNQNRRQLGLARLPAAGNLHGGENMRFTRMMIVIAAFAAGVGAAVLAGVAHAQGAKATINDPVGPPPDPTHIPTVLPENIKWSGQVGKQQTGTLFGDPSKPGLYGVVY